MAILIGLSGVPDFRHRAEPPRTPRAAPDAPDAPAPAAASVVGACDDGEIPHAALPPFVGCDVAWVRQLYRDVLGRPADPLGESYWLSQLTAWHSLSAVSLGFLNSAEWDGHFLDLTFAAYLGRTPAPIERGTFVAWIQGGVSEEQMRATLLGSNEYFATRGGSTNAGWLGAVYQDVLGRPVDAIGLSMWVPVLVGGSPRDAVALAIQGSVEGHLRLIDDLARRLLRRPADASLQAWLLPQFDLGLGEQQLVSMIVTTPEYQTNAVDPVDCGYPARPNPSFSVSPVSGQPPLTVSFQDLSLAGAGSAIVSWQWDFTSDGVADSTAQNPSFIYLTPGSWQVTLQVSDGFYAPVATTATVTVQPWMLQASTSGGGVGDLTVHGIPTAIAPGLSEGYLLVSLHTVQPVGTGSIQGFEPDALTWWVLALPAATGNPLHWLADSRYFPDVPLVLPPGTAAGLAGVSVDFMQADFDAGHLLQRISNVARVTF